MEAKEILDYLGIEANSLEEFKSQHSGRYYTEKQIHDDKQLLGKFTGKTLKKIKQSILNSAREKEIPFTQSEFDEADLEQVYETLDSRRLELFGKTEAELKAQIGKGGEEVIKPWQEKVSRYEQSLADEKKAKKEIADQFEGFKKEMEGKIKSTRIDYYKKDVVGDIEKGFDPMAVKDTLKMRGWQSHITENFRFDFDEQDNPIILDKSGSKIKNPKKADEWLSPKEVLSAEADKLGLIPKNPQAGRQVPQFGASSTTAPVTQTPAQNMQPVTPTRKLAPGMEKYLTK